MDKFYPKNFVMWRPHLLLLLIFLEAIYDSTGLNKGVLASYSADHKAYCNVDTDCKLGLACDKIRNECVCRNFFKKGSRTSSIHAVFFDKKSGKCVSPVGKVCTMDDELWQVNCVPYAICAPQRGKNLPGNLGLCECSPGFEETEEHLCKPAMVIQIADDKPIFTMSYGVGLPTAAGMTGTDPNKNEGTTLSKSPTSSTAQQEFTTSSSKGKSHIITSEVEDSNAHIEVYAGVVNNWKETKLHSSGGSSLCCLLVAVITLPFSLFLLY